MNNGRAAIGKQQMGDPTVVACVVFQTRDPEHLLELLREALTGIADLVPETAPVLPNIARPSESDPWLKHPEAAEYLGIATSTLYRYACQQKIESRKLCGRLEYRRSALDEFKDLHVRPASRWPSPGRIIASALGSGK
ncbi:MAG: helix-turn-helix domain-containing protein [Candidatus Acidiferrales bacterium]